MFDNVVVGVDDSASAHRALDLAKVLVSDEGRITLVYVEVVQTEPAPELDAGSVYERQRFGLERLRRLRDKSHVTADVARIQEPSVRRGLHEFAGSRAADLLVVGPSRRNKLARSQLGDAVREVLEDPPCPVAVTPNGRSSGPARTRKIGVAYDGLPSSQRALAVARRIAAERDATVSVYEAVAAPIDAAVSEARGRLAGLGDVERHAEFAANPAEGIRRFGASVDLLVLGSHTYRGAERAVHRTMAQRVAEETPSPLLVLASGARADGRSRNPSDDRSPGRPRG